MVRSPRFGQHTFGAGALGRYQKTPAFMHRQDQDPGVRIRLRYLLCRFKTIELRHGYIHDYGIRLQLLAQPQRFPTVLGFAADFPVVLRFQDSTDTLPHDFVIIDNQDSRNGEPPSRR